MNGAYFKGEVKKIQLEVKMGGAPEAAAELYPSSGGGGAWGCWQVSSLPTSVFPLHLSGLGLSSLTGGCEWDGQAGKQMSPMCRCQ